MQYVVELGIDVNTNDPLYKNYQNAMTAMDNAVQTNDKDAFETAKNDAYNYAGQLGAMSECLDKINKLSF